MLPKTCENFKALCTGDKGESEQTEYKLHYKDSLIHRAVKNGWIQGGGKNCMADLRSNNFKRIYFEILLIFPDASADSFNFSQMQILLENISKTFKYVD